jgi:hypothetical protein
MTDSERSTALRAGLDFILPVWGVEYTSCFTELCLPALLAPGNLPAVPLADRHVFQIYTTAKDRAAIEASASFRRLTRLMPVAFHQVRVHPENSANPHSIQSDCFRLAIRAADAADRAMVFLTPDMIAADGSMRSLAAIGDRPEVRAVLGIGVRLIKETVSQALLSRHRRPDEDSIVIAPRELVRLLVTELHPICKAHLFKGETEDVFLAQLYWRAGTDGLVARCFHLHPFLVYPRVKNAPFTTTVDGDYIEAACPNLAETYISADSDELCICELSAASRRLTMMKRSQPVTEFVQWMRERTTPRHRTLIKTVIRVHTGMDNRALWQQAERDAEAGVSKLIELLHATGAADAGASGGYVDAAKAAVPLLFVTALRNETEARRFAEVTLASIVAPANLASRINKAYCRYRIVATEAAAAILKTAPSFKELLEHVRVDLDIRAPAVLQADDFADLLRTEAVAAAKASRAAAMFIEPDTVFADDNFRFIQLVLTKTNIRALLAPRLRMRWASAAPVLRQRYTIDGILSIRPEVLVRLALEHLHPLARTQFVDGGEEAADPDTFCWKVGAEGALMHTFDLHPTLIYPRDGEPAANPVDHPILGPLGFADGEIGMIRDSSAFVQCQISDDDAVAPLLPSRDTAAIGAWAAANRTSYGHRMIGNSIRLYATLGRSELWTAAEAAAAPIVREIFAAASAAAVPYPRRA